MKIQQDFIAPPLAFFSDIQSFGLSWLQTVLGCLVTEGHCFAAGFGRRAILYHKARVNISSFLKAKQSSIQADVFVLLALTHNREEV